MLYFMSGGGGGQEDGPELPVPSPSPAQRQSTPAHAHEHGINYGKAQIRVCVTKYPKNNLSPVPDTLMQIGTAPLSPVVNIVHCTQHIVHVELHLLVLVSSRLQ